MEFGLVQGKSLSGKTQVCKILGQNHGFTVLDMNAVGEEIKKSKGEDEEGEGEEIPLQQIEQAIVQKIEVAKSAGGRAKFVFDSFTHETEEAFLQFIEQFGVPDFVLFLTCEERTIYQRWSKANEDAEVDDDKKAELAEQSASNAKRRAVLEEAFAVHKNRCNVIHLDTTKVGSIESLTRELNNNFSAKVVLVNHEKSVSVDSICANLAIKYNMLYISAWQ